MYGSNDVSRYGDEYACNVRWARDASIRMRSNETHSQIRSKSSELRSCRTCYTSVRTDSAVAFSSLLYHQLVLHKICMGKTGAISLFKTFPNHFMIT